MGQAAADERGLFLIADALRSGFEGQLAVAGSPPLRMRRAEKQPVRPEFRFGKLFAHCKVSGHGAPGRFGGWQIRFLYRVGNSFAFFEDNRPTVGMGDVGAGRSSPGSNLIIGANHHPVAVVNGNANKEVLYMTAAPGSSVALSAKGSSDPDGNGLVYSWSYYGDASSYNGSVSIGNSTSANATVQIPSNAGGQNIHIILALRDTGSPNLYAYRRVVINVQ